MRRSISILLVILMILSIALVGCGGNSQAPAQKEESKAVAPAETKAEATKAAEPAKFDPSKYPIIVCMPLKGHPVHRVVETGFLARAKELGYPAELIGIDNVSEPDYIAACETAITKGAKGIMLWAYAPFIYPTIKKLSDAGIKVIAPHVPVKEGDAPGLTCNLTADPKAYAKEVAKTLGEALKGKKGSIAITQGSFNTTENTAAESFKEAMKAYPDLKVLAPQEEGFDPPAAIAKAVAIIQGNPDLLAAFGTTGGSPQTWAGAIDQTGKKSLLAIGMDYTEQNIDLVKSGKIYGIVAQPLYDEASKSVDLLDQLFKGEKVPYFTPLDAPVVTKDGIDKYADIQKKVKDWFK